MENRERSRLLGEMERLIQAYLDLESPSGPWRIPLSVPSFGIEEIMEVLDSLLAKRVTMGEKVRRFEASFAGYVGTRHGVMVNSGSSANLVALSALAHPGLPRGLRSGDEVITTAVPWSTTVFPILQVGAIPVFVDIEPKTYNMDVKQIESAITSRTKAIMVVHLLGNPVDMAAVMELARRYDLFVIEDCCEAHGAEIGGRKVGSFGEIATFSFFFSHHISTIEGGIVLTDNDELADLARSMRAHGWVREMAKRREILEGFPYIDERYLFATAGYNLRPMELQGAFGLHQLTRLEGFIRARIETAQFWTRQLSGYSEYFVLPEEGEGTRHVWFCYPITIRPDAPFSRRELVQYLTGKGIETRPIMAGNMVEQPVMKDYPYRTAGDLRHAQYAMRHSILLPNHHEIGEDERSYAAEAFREFLEPLGAKGGK